MKSEITNRNIETIKWWLAVVVTGVVLGLVQTGICRLLGV